MDFRPLAPDRLYSCGPPIASNDNDSYQEPKPPALNRKVRLIGRTFLRLVSTLSLHFHYTFSSTIEQLCGCIIIHMYNYTTIYPTSKAEFSERLTPRPLCYNKRRLWLSINDRCFFYSQRHLFTSAFLLAITTTHCPWKWSWQCRLCSQVLFRHVGGTLATPIIEKLDTMPKSRDVAIIEPLAR